jgi:CDP-glucose 4,6-dehydratase
MGCFDPYSNRKGCAELVAAAYRNSYFHTVECKEHGVALASARAVNVIGGGDWAEDRLFPDILRSVIKGEPVKIRNPYSIRPWQNVFEPLTRSLVVAQKFWEEGTSYAEAWKFGPNDQDAKPVQWIVDNLTNTLDNIISWQKQYQQGMDMKAATREQIDIHLKGV